MCRGNPLRARQVGLDRKAICCASGRGLPSELLRARARDASDGTSVALDSYMSGRSQRIPVRLLLSAALVFAPVGAAAHHGWSSYDEERTLDLNGVIRSSSYEQPHGTLKLEVMKQTWLVVLAPPTRMKSRGLEREMLKPGTEAIVVGYPHRKTKLEMRAERITVAGKTVELR